MRRDPPDSAWSRVIGTRVRLATIAGVFCVIHILSGCTLESEKPDLALDTPGKYRAPHGAADAAVPKLDWWRGFRSRELVSLIEDAQAHNFDIAIAVAQIQQADAQVQIADAPLFPNIGLNNSASVGKSSSATGSGGGGGVSRLYASNLSASYVRSRRVPPPAATIARSSPSPPSAPSPPPILRSWRPRMNCGSCTRTSMIRAVSSI